MRILTDIVAAVGPPTLIRAIGPFCGSRALVARWQHSGAQIPLDASDAVRVTLALRGGHIVRDGNSQRMAAGSVTSTSCGGAGWKPTPRWEDAEEKFSAIAARAAFGRPLLRKNA